MTDYVKMAMDWDERAVEQAWADRILTGAGPEFWPVGMQEATDIAKLLKPTDTVMDYGCGVGRIAIPMARIHPGRVIGVDVSLEMLSKAARFGFEQNAVCPEWQRAKATGQIPIKSGTVNLVYECLVFQHIPYAHMETVLGEISRVLKANGSLLCAMPAQQGPDIDQKFQKVPPTDTWHSRYYSLDAWKAMMEPHGFKYVGPVSVHKRLLARWKKA